MKILVISDIHGNPYALEAVLRRHADADAVWALGDYIGFVPAPAAVVGILAGLRNLTAVKGNWEHQYLAQRGGGETPASSGCAASDRVAAIMREGFRHVTPPVEEYIASLPDSAELEVDGKTYHLAHAAAYDPFEGSLETAEGLRRSVEASHADVFLNGDTHVQKCVARWQRLFLNPGAVSWPSDGHIGADCMTIETDGDGPRVRFETVSYDLERAHEALKSTGLPSVENFLAGSSICD